MEFQSKLYQLKKQIQGLSDMKIRGRVRFEEAKIWLKQFNTEEEILLGHLILRNLIFKNEEQMLELLKQALRNAANYFVKQEDRERLSWSHAIFHDYNGVKFYAGPPSFHYEGLGKPGKSGEIITNLLKGSFSNDRLKYPEYFGLSLSGNEGYLLVDDAILSGHQIEDVINKYKNLMINDEHNSGLVVGLAHEHALEHLKNCFPQLRIFYGEIIRENSSIVSLSESWMESGIWPDDYRSPLEVLEDISIRAKFKKTEYLGHRNQGLLLGYSYGTPDNTIQILHGTTETWSSLLGR